MDADSLRLHASIADELLTHLRGADHIFDRVPRSQAIYDTTFHGCFRIEIEHGPTCQVAVEHVGGDLAVDWRMAEADRRRPASQQRDDQPPNPPPTEDEVRYRLEVFDADAARCRDLLRSMLALDWGEPTPDSTAGRDGVILSGALTDEVGVRTWTTWSPQPATEPAKAAFFADLARFAIDHASGELGDDLAFALS